MIQQKQKVPLRYRERKPKSENNEVVVVDLQSPRAKSKKKSKKRYAVYSKTEQVPELGSPKCAPSREHINAAALGSKKNSALAPESNALDLDAILDLLKRRAEEHGIDPMVALTNKIRQDLQGKDPAQDDTFDGDLGLSFNSPSSFTRGQSASRDNSLERGQSASQDNNFMFGRPHQGNSFVGASFRFDNNRNQQPPPLQGIGPSYGFESNRNQQPPPLQVIGPSFGFESNRNHQPPPLQGIGHNYEFESNRNHQPPPLQGIGPSFGFESNQNQQPPPQQGIGPSFVFDGNQHQQAHPPPPPPPPLNHQHSGQQGIGPSLRFESNPNHQPPRPNLEFNTNRNFNSSVQQESRRCPPPSNLSPMSRSEEESAVESVNEKDPEYNEELFGYVKKIVARKIEKKVLYYLCQWEDITENHAIGMQSFRVVSLPHYQCLQSKR
jgi:hypothetical protein